MISIRVLSLFDGMACGMIAMKRGGYQVDSYDAYEIDKYAIQSATHNFPEIVEHGDVFNADFREYTNMEFDKNTFIYCDPPYLSSTATYNEKNGWTERDELDLYDFLCKITAKNVRWALSNNLSTNPLLEEFANKNALKIHYLNNSYSNCNYHKKDKTNKDCEVLITNY